MRGGGAAGLHHRIRAAGGMVTAEIAVGILAVVPLVLGLVALVAIGAAQVKAVEAARTGARLLARGESEQRVEQEVLSMSPRATVQIVRGGGQVVLEVRHEVGGFGVLPSFTLRASAATPVEHV